MRCRRCPPATVGTLWRAASPSRSCSICMRKGKSASAERLSYCACYFLRWTASRRFLWRPILRVVSPCPGEESARWHWPSCAPVGRLLPRVCRRRPLIFLLGSVGRRPPRGSSQCISGCFGGGRSSLPSSGLSPLVIQQGS